MVYIPTIDFGHYDDTDVKTMSVLADQVEAALTQSGFMKIKSLGISQSEIDRAFDLSRWFFTQASNDKSRSAYGDAAENFGYQNVGVEHLDPSKPADLKETFTMRDVLNHDPADARWPSPEFCEEITDFFRACLEAAYRVQRVFACVLETDPDYFVQYHRGENVTLRLLHYPSAGEPAVKQGQLGAGSHTDYGMITLLFQRDVGGLEVQDAAGVWHAVPPDNDAIVINSGDLMERWTNGKFRSTPHRVQPMLGDEDRYSIAMFVDPDTDTPVRVLNSCVIPGEQVKYTEVTAGEHILERIKATH
ncbi:MAG: isopenicillin N synthase-like dioxygenase [Candidatus Azotimanducaceae bacterium]|jgi:isopenicillin N synthase-like dioxygenase